MDISEKQMNSRKERKRALVAGVAGMQELNDPTAAGTTRFYRVRHW